MQWHVLFGSLMLVLPFLCACATTVPLSYRVTDEEREAVRRDLVATGSLFKDRETRLKGVGQRILTAAGEDPNGIRFVVGGRYSGVLAYADDKRNVFVTPEMLRFVQSDDELAAVLGHEIAHIIKGHHGHRQVQGLFSGAAGALTGGAIDALGGVPATGPTAGDMAGAAVQAAVLAPFSKQAENEADALSTEYLQKSGYDARAMADVFHRMAVELPTSREVTFISTHPSTPERVMRLKAITNDRGPSA